MFKLFFKTIKLALLGCQLFGIDDAIIGGVAMGGISALGSLFGAKKSADASENITAKQIAWERERAKNAHQWEVNDLKAAGLNPILSAGGQGAVTGSINPPMPDTSGYTSAGKALQTSIDQVLQEKQITTNAKAQEANERKIQAEIAAIHADTLKKLKENKLISAEEAKRYAEIGLINEQAQSETQKRLTNFEQQQYYIAERAKIEQEVKLLEQEIKNAKTEGERLKLINEKEEKENKMWYLTYAIRQLKELTGIGTMIAGGVGLAANGKRIMNAAEKMGKQTTIYNMYR